MALLLKDLYNPSFIDLLIRSVSKAYPAFQGESFRSAVFSSVWSSLELKARMSYITQQLAAFLPLDYPLALPILKEAVSHIKTSGSNEYRLECMFFPDFVAQYGLAEQHLALSLAALTYFTPYASSEFAVRPFLVKYPRRLYQEMLTWAHHDNFHVRRLASEGIRPRLPWGMALKALKKDPRPIFPILDALKNDPELYVRRSVANNLNDISKDNPQQVLDTLANWNQAPNDNISWITKHALRGLVKTGSSEALALLGFSKDVQVELSDFQFSPRQLQLGEKLSFSFTLKNPSPAPQHVVVDYAIHFMKANQKRAAKVFKLKNLRLAPKAQLQLQKQQHFKPISTRSYYPGTHQIEILINGASFGIWDFELRIPDTA